jgi:hypothetical protein
MKFFIGGLLLMAATLSLVSCKKEENPVCEAGSGGNVQIVTFAIHNGDTLINTAQHPDTAFIHYGGKLSPGTDPASYDGYFVSEAGEDHIHMTHLKCGSYYIYRTGFDSVSQTRYTGGIGIEVTQTSGEVDLGIAVN